MPDPRPIYGGQAVIEGVMIRGQRFFSLAVRRLDGTIFRTAEPLSSVYTGRLRRIPLLRGVIVLIETLILGMKVLSRSANIAVEDQTQGEQKELGGWVLFLSLGVSMLIGVGIFFLMPLFAARSLDFWIAPGPLGDFISNFLEGLLRLGLLVGYISLIGLMKDIRRVFAYHGAEHMTIHAYERGLPLEVANIRPFSTAHPRCGTAFLLTVAVVAIFIFSLLGRPDIQWAILSRILLIPVIAGMSYEVIRFSGLHQGNFISNIVAAPGHGPAKAHDEAARRRPDRGCHRSDERRARGGRGTETGPYGACGGKRDGRNALATPLSEHVPNLLGLHVGGRH